jgi:hypothetical protein
MPRQAKIKKQAVVTPDIVDDEGILCLKGPLFWKWRALDAEYRTATMSMAHVKSKIEAEINKSPILMALFSEHAGLAGQISVAKNELMNVHLEIETHMGISLKDCAFDDKTGRLYNLSSDGARSEPVKPKDRRKTV